jgi:hypothetical protein
MLVEVMEESASHAGGVWIEKPVKMATSMKVGVHQSVVTMGGPIATTVSIGEQRVTPVCVGNHDPGAIIGEAKLTIV